MKIKLLNERVISLKDVLDILEKQKSGTEWAKKTNTWATDLAREFDRINGGVWLRGLLSEESFWQIILPEHNHMKKVAPFLIPDGTVVAEALSFYSGRKNTTDSECVNLIEYLEEQIRKNGFTDDIVLGVKNEKLYHIDGLHRSIAFASLINDGMPFNAIPVCLANGSPD